MYSGNYSWKRISMIKQFLHGTKHRLNGIRLGLPKQESFLFTNESLCEAIVFKIVVDQNSVIFFHTTAIELNQIVMLYVWDHINLCQELLYSLFWFSWKNFYSSNLPIFKPSLENCNNIFKEVSIMWRRKKTTKKKCNYHAKCLYKVHVKMVKMQLPYRHDQNHPPQFYWLE